jgi:DNA-binding XRE family transcriptional regulator
MTVEVRTAIKIAKALKTSVEKLFQDVVQGEGVNRVIAGRH